MDSSIIYVMVKIAIKYIKFQSVEGIGKKAGIFRLTFLCYQAANLNIFKFVKIF